MRTLPALLLVLAALTGCSDDDGCAGRSYDPDLGQAGAETPIAALEDWLDTHEGITTEPPDDGWTVEDSGEEDPARVVITNEDGHGWWVATVRTGSGGYVVDEATADAASCGDQLS
ncbi:MAG TPA: hypothetical protein VFT70_08380 [Nocardioides sp.]|nr:hypothetical protein [Nocardioides sp.]